MCIFWISIEPRKRPSPSRLMTSLQSPVAARRKASLGVAISTGLANLLTSTSSSHLNRILPLTGNQVSGPVPLRQTCFPGSLGMALRSAEAVPPAGVTSAMSHEIVRKPACSALSGSVELPSPTNLNQASSNKPHAMPETVCLLRPSRRRDSIGTGAGNFGIHQHLFIDYSTAKIQERSV